MQVGGSQLVGILQLEYLYLCAGDVQGEELLPRILVVSAGGWGRPTRGRK